ncbi:MAG: hypothetical protein ACYCY6_01390 [Minisyncoccota bacterium]
MTKQASLNGSSTLEWDAPEHEHKERSSDWFWSTGIIIGAIVLACIIFGNIIFGILILVSAGALALFINREPEDVHVIVNDTGIRRDRMFYPMETLSTFWIDVEHPHKKLILKSNKSLMPLIVIPLSNETDPEGLREFLLTKITEEQHSLPLVEKILEYLGF